MGNYVSGFFITMFVISFVLAIGLQGTNIENKEATDQFKTFYNDDFDEETGSNWYDTMLSRIVSFETVGGLVAGATVGFLVGGVGSFVVAAAVVGGFIGYAINYYSIINIIFGTLPVELSMFFGGFFGLIFIVFLIRILTNR